MRPTYVLMALAVAAPLGAQRPDSAGGWGMHRTMMYRMEGPGPHGGAAMRAMASTPMHLLMHKDDLKLTDAQVAKLTKLRDGAKAAHDAAMADVDKHQDALAKLMSGAMPDTNQMKTHFQAMQAAMATAHWAMISAAAQARGVLTEVQRARVDGWGDMMEMGPPMGPMMGPGGPMGHRMMMGPPVGDSTR